MLGKRSRPAIGKKSGIINTVTSPRSSLDGWVLQSPRRFKSNYCDHGGGVGLGIVIALDNNNKSSNTYNVGSCGGEILAKYAICNQFSSPSNPINVKNPSFSTRIEINKSKEDEIMEEEFTYVTCYGPNKSTTTKVYYSGNEFAQFHGKPKIGVFNISSPAKFLDDCSSEPDFLSSCHLCKKGLIDKDIYMYRGEKAFCSEECRQRQIGIDERKEQCRSEASRSVELSTSPCGYAKRSQIFSNGIVAI
ncbi:FCS-Like Zinc finger 13-like [Amaranthus tricolor]|uniref:FCS-Like Zinc finger 13-like n=1 Tax=Amaranthus tricolor TaxID=29722 RepID=UPI00258F6BAD|nr:FCS-Like Zinc finger 13-like [Amaranthus tricolor]